MTRVCEPLHDRPQALRHAGGRVADAVVIDQEKPHEPSVTERKTARQQHGVDDDSTTTACSALRTATEWSRLMADG